MAPKGKYQNSLQTTEGCLKKGGNVKQMVTAQTIPPKIASAIVQSTGLGSGGHGKVGAMYK